MNVAVYDCKYAWADSFSAGVELTDALDDETTWGDAAMTLVETSTCVAALEQWLEDAHEDLDAAECPECEARVRETISELKSLGDDVYVALNG